MIAQHFDESGHRAEGEGYRRNDNGSKCVK